MQLMLKYVHSCGQSCKACRSHDTFGFHEGLHSVLTLATPTSPLCAPPRCALSRCAPPHCAPPFQASPPCAPPHYPHLAVPHLAVPHPIVPHPTVPHLAVPCPIVPHPIVPLPLSLPLMLHCLCLYLSVMAAGRHRTAAGFSCTTAHSSFAQHNDRTTVCNDRTTVCDDRTTVCDDRTTVCNDRSQQLILSVPPTGMGRRYHSWVTKLSTQVACFYRQQLAWESLVPELIALEGRPVLLTQDLVVFILSVRVPVRALLLVSAGSSWHGCVWP